MVDCGELDTTGSLNDDGRERWAAVLVFQHSVRIWTAIAAINEPGMVMELGGGWPSQQAGLASTTRNEGIDQRDWFADRPSKGCSFIVF